MQIILCKNYDEISQKAAQIVAEQINRKPDSVLGLATGSSPIGMYNALTAMKLDFSQVITFNLDEYYPISRRDKQSYYYFMNEHLYSKVNLKEKNIHIPNGETEDVDVECRNYDEMLAQSGGIDLQILGIGKNGHIGFNEPSESLECRTHLTSLTQDTIESNSRFFLSEKEMPKTAITMGICAILKAKKIVLLASGRDKSHAINELLKNEVRTSVPASVLNVHRDVVLICDYEAYGGNVRLGIDIGGTNTKFGVLENGSIVYKSKIKTEHASADALADSVADECARIGEVYKFDFIGVGVPGDVLDGVVTADNLPLKSTPLKNMLEQRIGAKIEIENDANCAGLGELKCGAGRKYKNIVMLTLGTGVGGSIVIDGKLMLGNRHMGEFGHMIIQAYGGRKCPCGQSGCFEQYGSVTALVRMAEENISQNDGSILAQMYQDNGNKLNGEVIFAALNKGCRETAEVMDKYTDALAVGIDSLINILDPDAVVISGGITEQGSNFIAAIKSKIHFKTPVVISELKGDAGTVGAAYLTDLR